MTTAANPPKAGLPESPVSEREIDEAIEFLNQMGARQTRAGFKQTGDRLKQAALLLSSLKGRTTWEEAAKIADAHAHQECEAGARAYAANRFSVSTCRQAGQEAAEAIAKALRSRASSTTGRKDE